MENALDHRHYVLKITFTLLLALGVLEMAFAAPTANEAPEVAVDTQSDIAKPPGTSEMPATDAKEIDAVSTLNAAASGLQHFGLTPTPGAAQRMTTDAPLGHDISNSIKETLRPLHEDLAHSGIFNTIRNMESELGLSNNHEQKERVNGNEPRTISWGNSDDATAAGKRPRTETEVQEDKIRASVMLQQLIDEVAPWVAAAVAIYLAGYGIKLLLSHKRAKAARRLSRSSKRSRHQRRSRHPAEQAQAQALPTDSPEAEKNSIQTEGTRPP